MYVIPILLTFIYVVALNLLVNNQLNSFRTQLIIAAHNCLMGFKIKPKAIFHNIKGLRGGQTSTQDLSLLTYIWLSN